MTGSSMDAVYELLLERNARETAPFVSIYEAHASLLTLTDTLQSKSVAAEREIQDLRQQLNDTDIGTTTGKSGKGSNNTNSNNNSAALKSALKNETRLRDKLEKLSEEYNAKLKTESQVQADALKTATKLQELQDLFAANEKTAANLRQEIEDGKVAASRLEDKVKEAESSTKLAEQQYDGLKDTIRSLQEENDLLKKENRELEGRMVLDKGKMVDEMNVLTEMVDKLKKEVDMLRSLKAQEDKRVSAKTGWFGASSTKGGIPSDESKKDPSTTSRKFGNFGVICPSSPKHVVAAHTMEGTCVRYENDSGNLVASSSSDSSVKVWDANTGTVRATLRGSTGHSIVGCDISGSLVVGGGSDKTCRVWNLRTERMIHHLVGHQHKITCVRLFGSTVVTGSADRSMKVWDISRKTYRQITTLRHSSTSTCIDVATDAVTAVSGHMDGGVRLWDIRSGKRTADISGIHESGITSVQFSPTDSTQVLTNSLDSSLKIVDVRTGTAVLTVRHAEFTTCNGWSSSVFSPDGRYVAAGSNGPNGTVFVWDASDGALKAKLAPPSGGGGGHKAGVVGIDWCRGGSGGQQVCSIDRKGVMVLWA